PCMRPARNGREYANCPFQQNPREILVPDWAGHQFRTGNRLPHEWEFHIETRRALAAGKSDSTPYTRADQCAKSPARSADERVELSAGKCAGSGSGRKQSPASKSQDRPRLIDEKIIDQQIPFAPLAHGYQPMLEGSYDIAMGIAFAAGDLFTKALLEFGSQFFNARLARIANAR